MVSGLDLNAYLAVIVVFLVGFAIGAVNGFLIVRLGLNAFITTLAMLILLRGVAIGLTNGRTLYDLPEPFLYLGNAYWLGLPAAALWVSAGLYFVGSLILAYHRFGRASMPIGGNAGGGPGGGRSRRPVCLDGVRDRRRSRCAVGADARRGGWRRSCRARART